MQKNRIKMIDLINSIIYKEYSILNAPIIEGQKPEKTLFFNKTDINNRLKLIFAPEDQEQIDYNLITSEMLENSIATAWFKKNNHKFSQNADFNFYNTSFSLKDFLEKIQQLENSAEDFMLLSNCSIVVPFGENEMVFRAPILHIRKQDKILNIINKRSENSKKSDIIRPFFQKMLIEEIIKQLPGYKTFFAYATVNSNFDNFINKEETFFKGDIPIGFTTNINLFKSKKPNKKFKAAANLIFSENIKSIEEITNLLNLNDKNEIFSNTSIIGEELINKILNTLSELAISRDLVNNKEINLLKLEKSKANTKKPSKLTDEEIIQKFVTKDITNQINFLSEEISTSENSVWDGLDWTTFLNNFPPFAEFSEHPDIAVLTNLWESFIKAITLSKSDINRLKSLSGSQNEINEVIDTFFNYQTNFQKSNKTNQEFVDSCINDETEMPPELINWAITNNLSRMSARVREFKAFENKTNKDIQNNKHSILTDIEMAEGNKEITLSLGDEAEAEIRTQNLKNFYENNLKDKKLIYFDFETINPAYIATDDASTPPNSILVVQNSIMTAENNIITSSEDILWNPAHLTKNSFKEVVESLFKHCLNQNGTIRNDITYLMYSHFERTQLKKILEMCFPAEYKQLINFSQSPSFLKREEIVDEYEFLNWIFENDALKNIDIQGDVNGFQDLFFKTMTIISNLVDLNDVFKTSRQMFVAAPETSQGNGISIKTIQKMLETNPTYKKEIIDTLDIKPRKNSLIKNGAEATNILRSKNLNSLGTTFKTESKWETLAEELKFYCHTDVLNMIAVENFVRKTLNEPLIQQSKTKIKQI